jgi:hypothetical protein
MCDASLKYHHGIHFEVLAGAVTGQRGGQLSIACLVCMNNKRNSQFLLIDELLLITLDSGVVSMRRTIPPVSWRWHIIPHKEQLHGGSEQITAILIHEGTTIVRGYEVSILASQYRITSIDSYPIDIHSPAPGHDSSRPPDIVVAMHSQHPTSKPARVKTRIH